LKKLADDLFILSGSPPYTINVYLMGDVLVDAGSRHAAKRILRQLRGRTVATHALTHAHVDHQGSSHQVCDALRIPLWCGDADGVNRRSMRKLAALEPELVCFGHGRPLRNPHKLKRFTARLAGG
jgi:glyoxylase-like metal-dependent hydrolase (beta-lactamase superfamily II)